MSNTTTTNPSEGVSNHTSETSRNNNEDIIKHLEGMRVDWKLDLNDFISLVKELEESGKTKDEWVLFDHLSERTDVVIGREDNFYWMDQFHLWDKVEELIREEVFGEIQYQSNLVLDYLDREVV